ncbi:cancer-related nucleoside-triphosphatase [Lingula anatina]|uniref:Cancer-related nucleoside-triphosphatase n=1 Tax=Lingula anatina TaxID=7574 RepID=A0A1S3JTY1_LINAN|nr:cancer-related nucleoside-triphosphatase [Lingula anatina]|eukprot:XP_013413792.1 cancer-related nucleoside-triphosphatase [Lingula anatina]
MASSTKLRHILITGPPGVGKTTLVRKVCDSLKQSGVALQGFYTEEVRAEGRRIGFDVITLHGIRAPLSRVKADQPGGKRELRVGQYVVDIASFEQTALTALRLKDTGQCVMVIDEIGKMEMFSQPFIQLVRSLFSNPQVTVFATIPIAKGKPIHLVEELRKRHDAKLFEVSKSNRDVLEEDIKSAVKVALSCE